MPLTIPSDVTIRETSFRITWLNASPDRSRGGEVQVVNVGDPFWRVRLTTPPMTSEALLALRAWYDSMGEGALNTFLVHDYALPYPSSYPDGWAGLLKQDNVTPFDGLATLSALAANQITITALPDNFLIKRGDYIGLVQSGHYSLHQATADFTANTSGVATNVTVTPPINTDVFTSSATVNLDHPLVEVVPDNWSGDPDLKYAYAIPVSFGGVSRVA